MNKARIPLISINGFSDDEFLRVLGPVFEQAPWIAAAAWADRPFASVEHLHQALCRQMRSASRSRHLDLIRAHPDLVGRAAQTVLLTPESTREQASAGLNELTADEKATFQKLNQAYWERFGFPFVICARMNKKEAILHGFQKRLTQSPEQEMETALSEIEKIARLRLEDLVDNGAT